MRPAAEPAPEDLRWLDIGYRLADALEHILPAVEQAADRLSRAGITDMQYAADSIRTARLEMEMGTVAQLRKALEIVKP